MKGKRYTTEDKIRILREADCGEKSIQNLCQEANISEVRFHRWKRQFGHMEVNEARRMKELERENRELKLMLADSLLKNRVLEAVCEKKCKSGPSAGRCGTVGGGRDVFRARGLPVFRVGAFDIPLSGASGHSGGRTAQERVVGVVRQTSALRLSADWGVAAPERLAGASDGFAAVGEGGVTGYSL